VKSSKMARRYGEEFKRQAETQLVGELCPWAVNTRQRGRPLTWMAPKWY